MMHTAIQEYVTDVLNKKQTRTDLADLFKVFVIVVFSFLFVYLHKAIFFIK